jgi:hypothetical protein
MTQAINPSKSNFSTQQGTLRQAQSAYIALNGGLADAVPTGTDADGVYNTFQPDNGNGVMLRIGAAGSTEPIQWVTVDVGVVIQHGLQRQPIGFKLVDKDQSCDVYRTVPPDNQQITLATTNVSANVTVYVF